MKKCVLMLAFIFTIFSTGCGSEDVKETKLETTAAAETVIETVDEETIDNEVKETESETSESSAQESETAGKSVEEWDAYMASLKEKSDEIKYSLENDPLTQYELNEKSAELYKLWDDALNDLWDEIVNTLPEAEYNKLLDEQYQWIDDKEKAVEAAGKEYEGGSMQALVVNSEAAAITEERVYEFYAMLK